MVPCESGERPYDRSTLELVIQTFRHRSSVLQADDSALRIELPGFQFFFRRLQAH